MLFYGERWNDMNFPSIDPGAFEYMTHATWFTVQPDSPGENKQGFVNILWIFYHYSVKLLCGSGSQQPSKVGNCSQQLNLLNFSGKVKQKQSVEVFLFRWTFAREGLLVTLRYAWQAIWTIKPQNLEDRGKLDDVIKATTLSIILLPEIGPA